jgi:hypothetical protein
MLLFPVFISLLPFNGPAGVLTWSLYSISIFQMFDEHYMQQMIALQI